jgi:acid phosphatase (class A)
LVAFLNRANADASAASNVAKFRYQHKRPFQIAEGNVCVSPQSKEALEHSPDYPSGHTTLGWETGLILAELSPDDAIEVLVRARAFGQSRVVCGVHNLSAVEAGWMTANAVFAMQQSSSEFRKDLELARTEVARLRVAAKEKPPGCETEAQLLSKDPY